jgi:hypothetical protein
VPGWNQSDLEVNNPAIRAVYILAVCTRNHRRKIAEKLLESEPGSAEESVLVHQAVPNGLTECPIPVTKLKIYSRTLTRGALAEAIYNFEGIKPLGGVALPPPEPLGSAPAASPGALARWVARCAVRRSPLRAHAVVKYNPGDLSEGKALKALEPTLLACLPEGRRLQSTRTNFRALIAEELYHASRRFKESFRHAKS